MHKKLNAPIFYTVNPASNAPFSLIGNYNISWLHNARCNFSANDTDGLTKHPPRISRREELNRVVHHILIPIMAPRSMSPKNKVGLSG